jgi:hypothetical protein
MGAHPGWRGALWRDLVAFPGEEDQFRTFQMLDLGQPSLMTGYAWIYLVSHKPGNASYAAH